MTARPYIPDGCDQQSRVLTTRQSRKVSERNLDHHMTEQARFFAAANRIPRLRPSQRVPARACLLCDFETCTGMCNTLPGELGSPEAVFQRDPVSTDLADFAVAALKFSMLLFGSLFVWHIGTALGLWLKDAP
jgi:hypothetical protein